MNQIELQRDDNDDEIDLLALARVLYQGKYWLLALAFLGLIIGAVVALGKTDSYDASLTLQIEPKTPSIGLLGGLDLFAPKTSLQAEQSILLSRTVLQEAIDDLYLLNHSRPQRMPMVVRAIARVRPNAGIVNWFLKKGYTRDSAKVMVSEFTTPFDSQNAVYDQQDQLSKINFRLETDGARFALSLDGKKLLEGAVGERISAEGYSILVASTNVTQHSVFTLNKLSYAKVLQTLKKGISIAKQKGDGSIITLNYHSEDPQAGVALIDKMAEIYLRHNRKRSGAELAGSLEYLQQKLPEIKTELESSEAKLNSFRVASKTVDISAEAQALLDQMIDVEKSISTLKINSAEIQRKFTSNHPNYIAWQAQLAELGERKQQLQSRISKLPKTQQDIVIINRDVKLNNQIYAQMLERISELEVALAGVTGTASVLDSGVAFVKEQKRLLIIIIAGLVGLMLAAAGLLLRHFMRRGIKTDEQIQALGLSVYGILPLSRLEKKSAGNQINALALTAPDDMATEAIRSLRTSLHFAMLESKNKMVAITSAEPAAGKSFVALNLAILIAQSGAKTLLIDADMRRGRQHRQLAVENSQGFAGIIGRSASRESATFTNVGGVENLDFIPRGILPPNPTELLMSKSFADLMDAVGAAYDYIIIDAPPILAVADAMIIGEYVGTTMLITRAEQTTTQEIRYALDRFKNVGLTIKGAVLNAYNVQSSVYGYNYSYSYKQDKSHH